MHPLSSNYMTVIPSEQESSLDWNRQPAVRLAFWITAGIAAGHFLELPASLLVAIAGGIIGLGCLAVIILRRRHGIDLNAIYFILVLMCIGSMKYTLDSSAFPQNHISHFLSHPRQTIVTGTIAEEPVVRGNRLSFILQTSAMLDGTAWTDVRGDVIVNHWYRYDDTTRGHGLEYGDVVAVNGVIDLPAVERNPGEFNYRNYLELNNIYAVMRVSATADIRTVDTREGNIFTSHVVLPIRNSIRNVVESLIGGIEGAFLKGLLIGDRSGIPAEVQASFIDSGVIHVLAVSGLNVAFIALIVVALSSLIPGNRIIRSGGTILILLLYMAVAGATPSIVRATVMVVVVLLGRMMQRRTDTLNALAVSALIIYAYDTRQFFDIGFQLSYAAAISLVLLYPPMEKAVIPFCERYRAIRWLSPVVKLFLVSFTAQVGTMPLIVQYFGRISLVSFLANIAVVPAANIALALGLAMVVFSIGSSWLAGLIASAVHTLLYLTLHLITVAAHLSWSVIEARSTTGWHTIGYFVLLTIVYVLWKGSWKRKMLIALLAVANLLAFYPDRGLTNTGVSSGITVTFLDVGQGDATVIESPDGKALLIDAGSRSSYSDAGRRAIVPFLKRKGITHLDAFILTHDHGDHTGGARSVIESIPVKKIYFPQTVEQSQSLAELQGIIREQNIPIEFLSAGKTIETFDNSRLFVLHPCPASATGAGENLNNTSVVLRFSYGRSSILLMGDAEQVIEQELCSYYGDFLHSSVVKVAHHGSTNASSDRFIRVVKPDFAVVSVGKNNKFKHPSDDVLTRYHRYNVSVERTDEQGAVVFHITPDSLWKVHWH